jgi:NADH dehydrogenase/NADH:ubiquinone oxidoreductase subunit G
MVDGIWCIYYSNRLLIMKSIVIDNHKINVLEKRDTVLIGICEHLDIWLPRFCYHSELSIAGNCRMCLVETSVSPKPVVACATSINNDLIIKTNTLLIKKIRENILEFLLINHPLDCPICDQGGECDLQDLVIIFGSDRGRFIESKRSVLDKNLGPMIKTIMTRCIHCTRCIRFSSELIGKPYLGAFGRGDSTEIGTYVNRQLVHALTGNLIDICPVGAITSKPYAFRARPWELNSIETIDILDSLCSSIRVDTKNNLVYRILPSINTLVNECWISDKIRFSYDSITNQRLLNPLILSNNFDLVGHSWEYAFHKLRLLFTNKIDVFNNYCNFYLLTGDLLDLFAYYSSVSFF